MPPAAALRVLGPHQHRQAAVPLMASPSAWLPINLERDVAGVPRIYCKLCPPECKPQAFTSALAEGLHSNSPAQSCLRISARCAYQGSTSLRPQSRCRATYCLASPACALIHINCRAGRWLSAADLRRPGSSMRDSSHLCGREAVSEALTQLLGIETWASSQVRGADDIHSTQPS